MGLQLTVSSTLSLFPSVGKERSTGKWGIIKQVGWLLFFDSLSHESHFWSVLRYFNKDKIYYYIDYNSNK